MNKYFKFPTTKHIRLPDTEQMRPDKVLSSAEITELLSHVISIEEKIDGANLGISFSDQGQILFQDRGDFLTYPLLGQWKKLNHWIEPKKNRLFDILLDRFILFGEWCYATHSIFYNKLPDYFIGFDVYDKEKAGFLSVERRDEMLHDMGIVIIKQLGRGTYQLKDLPAFFSTSFYGDFPCEGIYVRWDQDGWLQKRAKLVRRDFRQNIEGHWKEKGLQTNQISCL